MASILLSLILYYMLTPPVSGVNASVELVMEPGPGELRKYIGDVLTLTCTVSQPKPQQDYAMSWVLPIHRGPGHDCSRVVMEEEPGKLVLTVANLHEQDAGNYTCTLAQENVAPLHVSTRLIVLPRGMVLYCSHDAFKCASGECIQARYRCDGKPDCLDGSDERLGPGYCGSDPCADKLKCEEGRCLPYNFCCREKDATVPNCTIKPNIACCKQLIHPAMLDQDLYYIQARPRLHQQWNPQPDSTLIMGCIVAIANLVTVGIIVGVRYHLWRSNGSSSRAHYHWSRLRSSLRPFSWGNSPPSSTDQYQLRSADSTYPRRIPGLRSDLLVPEILRSDLLNPGANQEQRRHSRALRGGVVLCPPSNAQPPQYSQLPDTHSGPPPAYHQVVGAPPPPYSSRDDLTLASSTDGSSLSLLHNNNNNGDINGNSMAHLPVLPNQNTARTSTHSTSGAQGVNYPRGHK